MNKILAVAGWEFWGKVKTKTFFISLLLTPIIIILFSAGPSLLSDYNSNSTKVIGIVDSTSFFYTGMKNILENYKLKDGQPAYVLLNLLSNQGTNEIAADSLVLSNRIDGYLLIKGQNITSDLIEYRSKESASPLDLSRFQSAFNRVKLGVLFPPVNINPDLINIYSEKTEITQGIINKTKSDNDSSFLSVFYRSFIYIILFVTMILSSGGMLIRSLVEEKSNRTIEILVSSCTSSQLLAGKVFGFTALGIAQVITWSIFGIILTTVLRLPAEIFHNLLPMFFYFVLGFIFYTAIFVGIGSIVNTEHEAQQITSYLSLALILPISISVPAIENPNSIFVQILSYIPFTIPSIMILKFNVESVSFSEIIISSFIMLTSIFIVIKVSAKIFRIGILSFGIRPSLGEIMNWLKEK